jgi:hypothetical protein
MAIVVRYFSTTGAGAEDGTSWADRAPLLSGTNWGAVFTGLAFNGSDAYECRIGPGTYTLGQSLTSARYTNPPTIANMLYMYGCDSSGNALVNDTEWTSAQPADWESSLPVIETSFNESTIALANCFTQNIKFTGSGRTSGSIIASALVDFCVVASSASNTGAVGVTTSNRLTNSVVRMSGTAFNAAISGPSADSRVDNIRLEATGSPSSGNRHGIANPANSSQGMRVTAYGFDIAINCGQANAGRNTHYSRCTLVANRVGINANSQASQTSWHNIQRNVIANNSGAGIEANSAANVIATNNRLRNNTGGDFTNAGNYPTDQNITAAGTDADEFVDYAGKDFRLKASSSYWGLGIGAGDEPSAGGGGGGFYVSQSARML